MKKFSQYIWNLYKHSAEGQEAIALFRAAQSPSFTDKQMLSLARKYDERYFTNSGRAFDGYDYWYYRKVREYLSAVVGKEEREEIALNEEAKTDFFKKFILHEIDNTMSMTFDELLHKQCKEKLYDLTIATWVMYSLMPEAFIPNLFALQYNYLVRFAQMYEITLPTPPNRSAYKDRCMYYLSVNKALLEYVRGNGISTPEEICAFWFGLAIPLAKESIEEERATMPDKPWNAWLLVGKYRGDEKKGEKIFWQANQLTEPGDVMLFYEMYPVKKLNSVWIAQEDGVVDPFFMRYSYTYIGDKITIPDHQAPTYEEFRDSDYFKTRDTKGNFVIKNFQDCCGWRISPADYEEIKRMLEAKGFDTGILPSLYESDDYSNEDIHDEEDVYNKLVTPLLENMGWKKGIDFKREVEFAAGHTTTHHESNKRPDYCLHLSHVGKKVYAKVVIEAKLFIKGNRDLEESFDQLLSYALWGKAKVIVLCDKNNIDVYEPDRNGHFDMQHHHTRYHWRELKAHQEKFDELRRKFAK